MLLHTVNKAAALELCRGLIAEDDLLVLLEDGVYLALEELPGQSHAILADVEARGVKTRIKPATRLIGYDDFVKLTVAADRVCCWF